MISLLSVNNAINKYQEEHYLNQSILGIKPKGYKNKMSEKCISFRLRRDPTEEEKSLAKQYHRALLIIKENLEKDSFKNLLKKNDRGGGGGGGGLADFSSFNCPIQAIALHIYKYIYEVMYLMKNLKKMSEENKTTSLNRKEKISDIMTETTTIFFKKIFNIDSLRVLLLLLLLLYHFF